MTKPSFGAGKSSGFTCNLHVLVRDQAGGQCSALKRQPSGPFFTANYSVLAWRLGAEVRDQLLNSRLTTFGARWRPFLQPVVFADRNANLKVLAAGLALEFVDRHDFCTSEGSHHRQRPGL